MQQKLGVACFFVKHVKTGMCINVTGIVGDSRNWGNFTFVGLSNKCLDPTVQYRFRDNSALLNLKRKTCFEGTARSGNGYNLPMLYLKRDRKTTQDCRTNDHAATQTSWGGLSITYHLAGQNKGTLCAVPREDSRIKKQGVNPYIGLEDCNDAEDRRFKFGSVTCHGNAIKNANCPMNQYMVVKTASYRRLSPMKTCGLSNDYSCKVDVTCLVKKQCDGQHECNITVDDNLFSGNLCLGSTRYLYFEYQCIDTARSFKNLCVPPLNVRVTTESSSSLSVTWEQDKRNSMTVSYTVCVSRKKNERCFREYTTNKKIAVIHNLKTSTKYFVRVFASTKDGRGPFSKSQGKFTNGKQPEVSTNKTASTLTFFLQTPPRNFTHFYVVVLKLKDGKKDRSPASYENNELVTYTEARQSTDAKPYIAAILISKDGNMFILGDSRNTNIPTLRRRRSTSSGYYNGPLEPDTSYSIFLRIFINNKGDYYSTDWSPPSKTMEYSENGEKCTEDDQKLKYLVGILILAILLLISFTINVYLMYQNGRLTRHKSSKANRENDSKDRNNFNDNYENELDKIEDDDNYEQVENEQSTYTALNRTGEDKNDDHVYAHLNEEHKDYENQ